jgi:phosphoglycerate dehydrogenase-like enzyme
VKILFLGESYSAARAALADCLHEDDVTCCAVELLPGAAVGADVLVPIAVRIDGALMDAGSPTLIHQFGVGVESVDLVAARARAIPVARVPADITGNARAVAELVVLHLLLHTRRYEDGRSSIARRAVGEPVGRSVVGMRAAIVGMGAIGSATSTLLGALGVEVRGVRRGDDVVVAFEGMDLAVVCCPLTDQTRGLLGLRELRALAPGALVVNVARGPVIERRALLAELRSGHLGGAGLDVFWDEPIDPKDPILVENVTATPHVGGVTVQSNRLIAARFAENVERLRRGEPILDRVA